MYKVLIVDDEKMIRMGMSRGLPWASLNVSEVYQAASAMEALEIVKEKQPDLMITDINMPEMTGLELIEKTNELQKDIRIIVITGYDRFDYAQDCLRMHVQDLFLKPIEEDVLAEAIRRQIESMEKEKNEWRIESAIRRVRGNAEQVRVEKLMRRLIQRQPVSQEETEWLCREYSVPAHQELQLAVLWPGENREEEKRDIYWIMSIKDICTGLVDARGQGITFLDKDENIWIAFFNHGYVNEIYEKSQEVMNIIKDEFDRVPKMVLGSSVEGFENLYRSRQDVLTLGKENGHRTAELLQSRNTGHRNALFQEIYDEIKNVMCMNVGNSEYIMHVFESFANAVQSYNLTEDNLKKYCFDLASSVYFAYSRSAGTEDQGKLENVMKSIMLAESAHVCEVTRSFFGQIFGREKETMNELILKVRTYIDEHLEEELSVSSIASHFYITPNYLSKLYKKVTREGCNEYIVRKRMEKARYLLEHSSHTAAGIASMVGYRDPNYFSMAFKKYTGYSPTAFRQYLRDGDGQQE